MPAKADEHGFRYVVAIESGEEEQPAAEHATSHRSRPAELLDPELHLVFEPDLGVRIAEIGSFEHQALRIEYGKLRPIPNGLCMLHLTVFLNALEVWSRT